MRILHRLLLAATLTFTATLSAQQSEPVAPSQVPLPPSLRSNSAPPNSVNAVRVSGGVMASMLIKHVSPVVTECGHSGTVVLHAIIAKDGTVQQLSVLSGPSQLYPAVVDAVRQWEYKPYLLNGNPVNADTTISLIVDVNGCSPSVQAQSAPSAQIQTRPPTGHTAVVDPDKPMRVSGGVMATLLVRYVDPEYPADVHSEGTVVLHAIIGPDGRVTDVAAIAGPPALRTLAEDAVRQWEYTPYRLNGRPVAVDTTVTVNFKR